MEPESSGARWREWFRRHERKLVAAWLAVLVASAAALAVTPIRVAVLTGLERAVDRWDERWTRRLAYGQELVRAGAYAEAAEYLERLDRVFPARDIRHARDRDRELLLELLAISYERLDKKTRAMETYDRLIAFDSLNYYNYFVKARAAERMLSGWALAPEARDGYAAALTRHPSHLPSLRGYVDYYMDRGEFMPVVGAYQAYLDAFFTQQVTVRVGGDSLGRQVLADGLARDLELPIDLTADSALTMWIRTEGFPVRIDGISVQTASRVGALEPVRTIEVSTIPVALHDLEDAGAGALRPTGRSTAAAYRLPPVPDGIAGVRIRLRLYKPIDDALWRQVAKSYRNLLDPDGLRQASERTLPVADGELADRLVMEQMWTRGGLLQRLDVGT